MKSWHGCNEEVKAELLLSFVQPEIPGLSPAIQFHMGALNRPIPQCSHSVLFYILAKDMENIECGITTVWVAIPFCL